MPRIRLSRESQKTLAARLDKYHDNSFALLDAWRDRFETVIRHERLQSRLALLVGRLSPIDGTGKPMSVAC